MVREYPSHSFPGEGCFIVKADGKGFAIWFRPATKEASRSAAEQWLMANARPL